MADLCFFMKLVEKKVIQATPEMVWEIVHDPGNMPAWNHKCVTSETPAEIKAGAQFQCAFQMRPGAERGDMLGEVVAFQANQLIHFRFTGEMRGREMIAEEILELKRQSNGSLLIQHTVDLARSGLPKWVQVLAVFLNKFGRKAGEGSLDHIEDLVADL